MRLVLLAVALARAQATGLALIAVGDWGGESDAKPTNAAQEENAAGMAAMAKKLDADSVLLLGDNFYLKGVADVSSPRFRETFEDVYTPALFNNLPFHIIAGNHDHVGNVQAQLDYHGSARWDFPSLYYSLPWNYTSSSGAVRTVELLMIDTVELAGLSDDVCQGCELPGPPSVQRAEDQWAWLEARLNASTADFLWVAGHYPIYSAGQDGSTQLLVQRLLPLLKQAGAHYMSGHDHMLEHLVDEGVQMFVNGMGRYCCYRPDHIDSVPKGLMQYMITGVNASGTHVGPAPPADGVYGGFASLQFDEAATVTYYRHDGLTLYAAPTIAPRARAA